MCKTDEDLFLPADIGAMITYLDKRYQLGQLRSSINQKGNIKQMNELEVKEKIESDLASFVGLF